jgi:hypothetical protein
MQTHEILSSGSKLSILVTVELESAPTTLNWDVIAWVTLRWVPIFPVTI